MDREKGRVISMKDYIARKIKEDPETFEKYTDVFTDLVRCSEDGEQFEIHWNGQRIFLDTFEEAVSFLSVIKSAVEWGAALGNRYPPGR